MEPTQHLVVFGANGAIGNAVVRSAVERGWKVTAVSRKLPAETTSGIHCIAADPLSAGFAPLKLAPSIPYTSACWAQGSNINDSVYDVDFTTHRAIYETNCLYILITLQALLQSGFLAAASRLCVISSVWQNLARQSKLSYCMSKAALQGLVLSASADLAADGHLINAVLPGAIDTPMTRDQLSSEQLDHLKRATLHDRLVTLQEVASVVCYLCSPQNTALTGQFAAVDLGFGHVRIV